MRNGKCYTDRSKEMSDKESNINRRSEVSDESSNISRGTDMSDERSDIGRSIADQAYDQALAAEHALRVWSQMLEDWIDYGPTEKIRAEFERAIESLARANMLEWVGFHGLGAVLEQALATGWPTECTECGAALDGQASLQHIGLGRTRWLCEACREGTEGRPVSLRLALRAPRLTWGR
jgi:hypothetical protein